MLYASTKHKHNYLIFSPFSHLNKLRLKSKALLRQLHFYFFFTAVFPSINPFDALTMFPDRGDSEYFSLDNASLGQCVPWTMRPLDNVSLEQCVPWTMWPWDETSLTDVSRPWTIYSIGWPIDKGWNKIALLKRLLYCTLPFKNLHLPHFSSCSLLLPNLSPLLLFPSRLGMSCCLIQLINVHQ